MNKISYIHIGTEKVEIVAKMISIYPFLLKIDDFEVIPYIKCYFALLQVD